MAWRVAGKKGIPSSFVKAFTAAPRNAAVSSSKCNLEESLKAVSVQLFKALRPDTASVTSDDLGISSNRQVVRFFHATPEARRNEDFPWNSSQRKGKFKNKTKRTTAPVEAPYVPTKLKKVAKSSDQKTIEIFEGMTIKELAEQCGETIDTVQRILENDVGEKVDSEFDTVSIDIAEMVAMGLEVNVRRRQLNEGAEILPRPPVVTVMGHVDHGKTSLLDALRQTSVAAREAGGITQHLGAFVVGMQSGASITFLDTPGHAAFSGMRARGAAVTDIVVLVVAADDGVMPQTLEAMSHAKAAGVPIVVAINKCDKATANPERVKVQLAAEGLPLEEVGGDVQVVEVSAVNKIGLDKLEEALLLQAELMELKARIDGPAQAYVVEARLDRGRGPLATAIVKAGTLVSGQYIVVGAEWGRIRAIRDMVGKLTDRARPAMPIEIEGLKGLPMAGDDIIVVHSEERARMLSEGRKKKREKDRLKRMEEERLEILSIEREEEVNEVDKEDVEETVEEEGNEKGRTKGRRRRKEKMIEPEIKAKRPELPILVKADVQGTVEAVTDALKSLNTRQLPVFVVHVGVGPISQSDVDLAQACNACIVGFNVRTPPTSISQAAAQAGVKMKLHRVIYHLLEDIGNLIVEKAPGTFETHVAGEAQVLSIFELKGRSKAKGPDVKIAGCRVTDGRVTKYSTMRLLRSGEVIFEGSCTSLKREKQDVDTVGKGNECGLVIHDYFDFQVGDIIQCLEQVNIKPRFISSENGAVRIQA